MVDLSKIGLATKEDEDCGLAYWARLFKANTWEELNMLANKNDYLEEAAKSIYIANADEIVRQKCRAREEAERTVARDMRKLKEENAQLTSDNVQLTSDNAQLTSDNVQLTSDNNRLKNQILDMETRMDALIAMVEQLQKQVTKEEA